MRDLSATPSCLRLASRHLSSCLILSPFFIHSTRLSSSPLLRLFLSHSPLFSRRELDISIDLCVLGLIRWCWLSACQVVALGWLFLPHVDLALISLLVSLSSSFFYCLSPNLFACFSFFFFFHFIIYTLIPLLVSLSYSLSILMFVSLSICLLFSLLPLCFFLILLFIPCFFLLLPPIIRCSFYSNFLLSFSFPSFFSLSF